MFTAAHFSIEGMIMTCGISKTKQTIRSYVHYKHRGIRRGLIHRDFFMMIRKYKSYGNIFIKKLTNIKNPS